MTMVTYNYIGGGKFLSFRRLIVLMQHMTCEPTVTLACYQLGKSMHMVTDHDYKQLCY